MFHSDHCLHAGLCVQTSRLLIVFLIPTVLGVLPAQETRGRSEIARFLKTHCTDCHNAKTKKAGINVSELDRFTADNSTQWQDLLNNVQRGDMPPKDADQPDHEERRAFLGHVRAGLDRLLADSSERDFRFTRLTNQQIAWSLQDVLQIDRDFSGDLIEDPIGKHGESLQSTLELTAGHMEVYLAALEKAVTLAVPDLANPPTPYQLHGSDWEKQHYLNRNDLAHGSRRHHRRYRGPRWLEDDFEVPLPPNHFFRIYVDDNRSEGQFRIRVFVRNEPPQNGGKRQKHEFSLFFDKGFKSPQHTIDSFTVEAKPGLQKFELFGNVFDFPGVDPAPLRPDEEPYGVTAHFKYRFLTIQNSSPLFSSADSPVTNKDWVIHGAAHFVRADDRWIDAWGDEFGTENWLKRSHGGSNHDTRGKPSVYKEVMKDTGYAVIERIEFDMPWHWPPASVSPFLKDGKLTDASITRGLHSVARRAWRRPLTDEESKELDSLIQDKLKHSASNGDALRDLLMAVFADSRFLFLSDVEQADRLQNFELVSRLAGYVWRSVPDDELLRLANRDVSITDAELVAQLQRMLRSPKSERFVHDFTAAWMAFHKLDQIAINPNYYRWWNPKFKDYIKQQPVAFFSILLRDDLNCLNCLSSDFVVLNDIMAKYYGLPVPASGHRFSRVPAPEHRGGILTQPAFLLAHGDGEDAHAVNRGVWLRSRLLGDPPRDPPPEIPTLDDLNEIDPDSVSLSTTARLDLHRKGICYDCHQDIDAWGIAMESFDAAGRYREKVLRLTPELKRKSWSRPVVKQAEIRGQSISGMTELKQLLREQHADDFAHGFSASMLSFALGRPLSYREDDAVNALAGDFKKNEYRMAALISSIVISPEFRHPNMKQRKKNDE